MRAMRPSPALEIRPFRRQDLRAARDMTFYNVHVHTHLDWQTVDEFLRDEPPHLWVAYRGARLVGLLGLSEPLGGISWLRVAAAYDRDTPHDVLDELWSQACAALKVQGVQAVAALLLRDWLDSLVRRWGFHYIEHIITLRRYGYDLPELHNPSLAIAQTERWHEDAVARVDHAAFAPPWQMTAPEVRQGMRAGAYNTLAVIDSQIVGYQITTTHGLNGHLARLAVLPQAQGRGVGGALLRDMIAWFQRRRVLAITVNTQESNVKSQRLYERYGFQRNGYDLPVWMLEL